MKVIIKANVQIGNNYNRFGKLIPREAKEIDIKKYFNCSDIKAQEIYDRLKNDKNIEIKELKPIQKETKENNAEEIIINDIEQETEEPKKRGRKKGL